MWIWMNHTDHFYQPRSVSPNVYFCAQTVLFSVWSSRLRCKYKVKVKLIYLKGEYYQQIECMWVTFSKCLRCARYGVAWHGKSRHRLSKCVCFLFCFISSVNCAPKTLLILSLSQSTFKKDSVCVLPRNINANKNSAHTHTHWPLV